MTAEDERSVGELLLESDLAARRLLLDAERLDVGELASAWSPLLQAADEFIAVLPRRGVGPEQRFSSIAPDPSLGRLRAVTDRLERLRLGHEWLASAPLSAELCAIRNNLVRAQDLVARHHQARPVPASDVLADGAAARTRVIHTLYVTAHAVSLAARHAATDRSPGSRQQPGWRSKAIGGLRAVQTLADSLEQLAGEEVRRTYPTALQGEWREVPSPSRLSESLAAWEVEARRAMVGSPTPADRAEVVRIQGALLAMGRVLMGVAAQQGAIDRAGFRDLVAPRWLELEGRVGDVRAMVQDLATRGAGGLDARLARAGSEVVLAHTEIVLDGTTIASPAEIARRSDLHVSSTQIADALPAAAGVLTQLGTSLSDPAFTTNAAGLQQLINRIEGEKGLRHESPTTPWIDPRDLALGRVVAPPDWIRAELDGALNSAMHALSLTIDANNQLGLGMDGRGHSPAGGPSPATVRPLPPPPERGHGRSARAR